LTTLLETKTANTRTELNVVSPGQINAPSTAPTSFPPPREQYGKPWRWLTVIAGLALAATFFTPFTGQKVYLPRAAGPGVTTGPPGESDSVIDSPYALWGQFLSRMTTTPAAWWSSYLTIFIALLVLAVFPQFWGLAMAIYSLSQLLGRDHSRSIISLIGVILSLVAGILLTVLMAAIILPILKAAPTGLAGGYVVYLVVLGAQVLLFILVPILHALRAMCLRRWAYLYHGFVAAFLLVCPLSLIVTVEAIAGPKPYGAALLVVASCLLFLARIGEARAVSRLSWFWTIVGLFFLRLHRWALPPGHCPACGYNLHALTEPRCPECGRPFTFDELGVAPEELGYRVASPESGP
jgi:hypothetical protein